MVCHTLPLAELESGAPPPMQTAVIGFLGRETEGETCTDKIATLQSCLFGLANLCRGAGHELVVHF